MNDARIDQVIAAIERQFPGTTVVTRRCPDPAAHDIECMIDVLDAPNDPPLVVETFALTYAIGLYGDDPIPFLVGGYSCAESVGWPRDNVAGARAAPS